MAGTATLVLNELRKCCVSKWAVSGVGIVSHFMALIHFNTPLPELTGVGGTSDSQPGGKEWYIKAHMKC